jgi:hypothetical protein
MAVFLSPVGGVAAQFFTNTGAVLTGGKLYTYAAGTTTPAVTYTSSGGGTYNTNPIILDAAGRVSGSGEIWLNDGAQYKFVLKDSNDVLIATYDNITGINSNFSNFLANQEIQTATAGQTVFTLANPYVPGANTLSVFVDGVNQYGPGATYAYLETNSTTVTFVSGLHVGASVKFTTVQSLTSTQATSAALVSYTQGGTNAVTTTVQAKLRQMVSVMDFGAVADGNASTGTGTDNYTAFSNAIAALGAGGSLYVPAGIYKISAQITVPSNFSIVGSGPWTTILFAPTAFNSDGLIKFNGIGGPPTSISNLAIIGQTGGVGASSIGLNLAANGSFATNIWLGSFKTNVKLANTSVFLYNSVIDEGMSGGTGILITFPDTIVGNVQVYNNYVGVDISSVAYVDGSINLDNVQIIQSSYAGITISNSSNVQISNCSVGSAVAAFSYGGIVSANSSNISISNFIARLASVQTSGNGGIYVLGSNTAKINISNSQISGFYNGINITNGAEFTITGNSCGQNYNVGIYASNCDNVLISGNNCRNDGSAAASNAGIYSNNTAANSIHNIIGNICTQAGGGVQEYGIYANLTNNGASSGFTNIVGNIAKYNNTTNISTNGYTANISSTGNVS